MSCEQFVWSFHVKHSSKGSSFYACSVFMMSGCNIWPSCIFVFVQLLCILNKQVVWEKEESRNNSWQIQLHVYVFHFFILENKFLTSFSLDFDNRFGKKLIEIRHCHKMILILSYVGNSNVCESCIEAQWHICSKMEKAC